jgi:aryl-alcohol dehydrogenase-like predicted oxidoreductase
MKRRDFVRQGTAAAAFIGWGGIPLLATSRPRQAQDLVTLGNTGLRVSRLAQGTGTHGFGGSSNQSRQLGFSGLAELLRAGVDQGLTFWDLADTYGTHGHAREALKTLRRDQVVIMTKTEARTEGEMRADLDRFRREIGTDRIDVLLLHCLTEADWPRRREGAMAVLSEAKEKGVIGAHGVSCHSLDALRTAAATDWVEVDLARFNPTGAYMDAAPRAVLPVLEEMKRKGKGVIGMKILGQGELRHRVDEALAYALASPVLDAFTIGAESRGELADLLTRIPAASLRA